ncbi:protein boule-like isoform X2 [Brachyhypopomus gauderio]|uniref:protein boule-like isoform X2 n=1 Tax=Brachyhypopomus gauderio TaxID=698409 RepID=UPI0040427232
MESEAGTQTSSPPTSPAPARPVTSMHHAPRFGTVIPNRIFVGGIDVKTNENDLRRFFSQFGVIKEVKIVIDRAGVSKGYGFVTFESKEDAQKILHDADRLCFREKKLNIGQAIRKQQVGVSSGYTSLSLPTPEGTMYLTTPTGYPYTYHNGVAYFNTPEPSTHNSHWPPSHVVSGSPVMVTHTHPSFCTPQTYHQYQHVSQGPTQCVTGYLPWAVPPVESPVPLSSTPMLYMQPAELMYPPMELPSDGGCVQTAVPLMEAALPEAYVDHMVQPPYQVCVQSAVIMSPDGVKQEHKVHPVRRGYCPSLSHLKPRYSRGSHFRHLRKDFVPDPAHNPAPPAGYPAQDALK